ncbi:ABC transporter substrate-binding protein [Methylocapsa sp. S129]|uniref:ABC transporter substrate-binding protein n=1 Tax=Methylocapsa sp. S129 TaxID=1641869 RepID=UPI00131C1D1F|nr:ABC transporter substrate-binding protein [Methylocapsa sp. S129]
MMFRTAFLTGCLLAIGPAFAAEPVRIGVTTILSGPLADRGQSEQYGVELALQRINQAGGVLGRPVEAVYGDNAADIPAGIAATKRLIEEQHAPVLLGALATPVTHAIMPIVQEAKVPLVIDISAGQDFVDASGVGGNDYVFKTIPSDLDIATDMMDWLKGQGVHSVAIVADDNDFNKTNAASMEKAAAAAGLKILANETIAKGTTDLAPLLARFKALAPDRIVTVLGVSTAAFFHAYEHAGWSVPVTGRIDFATAIGAVSPQFLAKGGLDSAAGVTVFTPFLETPGVQDFVHAYRAKYGLTPTQRSFFAYEATYLVVDAIRRANSDRPGDIQQALKSSKMPSLLGGTYAMDDHNHPHTPMQIVGVREGKISVIAQVGG